MAARTARSIPTSLRLALEIDPQFAGGRLFLARIYLVKNERLDEAVSLVEGRRSDSSCRLRVGCRKK